MTLWWHCPQCNGITDEFESDKSNKCPKCIVEKEKEMTKIFQTRFYKVENKQRHHNAVEWYFLSKTVDGKNYLFTKAALDEAETRAEKNPEDIPGDLISINPEEVLNEKEWLLSEKSKLENALDIEARSVKIWKFIAFGSMFFFYALGRSVYFLVTG